MKQTKPFHDLFLHKQLGHVYFLQDPNHIWKSEAQIGHLQN